MSYGFPRDVRLHLKNDFKAVIRTGRRIQSGGITLWHKPAPFARESVRLGLVVSRKLGPAVVRNRTKRLLREAFRLNRKSILSGTDIVLSPQRTEDLANAQQAQLTFTQLCQRAGIMVAPS